MTNDRRGENYTEEEIQALVQGWFSPIPTKQIAENMKRSVQSLLHQARKLELPPRVEAKHGRVVPKESYSVVKPDTQNVHNRKIANIDRERFKKAYESGVPISLIRERFSISEDTVRQLVRITGAKPRVVIKPKGNRAQG